MMIIIRRIADDVSKEAQSSDGYGASERLATRDTLYFSIGHTRGVLGMCGIRILVRFLKTHTEQKVKPEISVSVAFLKTELVSYK